MTSRRDERRAFKRSCRIDLAANGCRCTPTIRVLDPGEVKAHAKRPGVKAGAFVQHETRCPLGQVVAEQNRHGIFPALYGHGQPTTRCGR